MTSMIDATKPITGSPTTQSVRDNFAIAKSEISDLQLARVVRLESVNEATELFQACAVNNVQQVIQFNTVRYLNPNSAASFEFDSVNSEIQFNEAGWYNVSIAMHIVRKTAGASLADWAVNTQIKPPGGSFANLAGSMRTRSFDGTIANFKEFVGFSAILKVDAAGTRARVMQTCSDVTKNVGIISYPAVAPLPSGPGIVMSIIRIGSL